jgi:uncharacterized protein YndB with AHSA1/START domain
MSDRIEKTIDLKASPERVWTALTTAAEFSQWFGVRLEGPFVVGQWTRGPVTFKGYEHVIWEARILRMEPPRLFAFSWHPFALEPEVDYSQEPETVVEFSLEPTATGTRLTVVETGFDALPPHRRDRAFGANDRGWTAQMQNIQAHVEP